MLSERYITDRYLPDKAIDLLDEACACAALRNNDSWRSTTRAEQALTKETNRKQEPIQTQRRRAR